MTRSQKRSAKLREKNNSVEVLCMEGHTQEGWTIKMLKSHCGLDATPGISVSVDIPKEKCRVCFQLMELAKEVAAPKRDQRDQRDQRGEREDRRKPKVSSAQRDADKAKSGVLHRFRPDQETRVTLHNVHFVSSFKDGSQAVCKGSFHGKVMKVDACSDNEVVSAKVLVSLLPRKDVSFQHVSECHVEVQAADPSAIVAPTFLEMRKTKKQGRCFVSLNYEHLSRDVGLVFLGSRCNPDKCDIEENEKFCRQHALDPIEKLQIITPPTSDKK